MSTVPSEARDILMSAVRRLQEGGVASPALDSRLLLGTSLGLDRAVLPHETLDGFDDVAAAIFEASLTRRLGGEPVSRIRGWRDFWTLRLELAPATFDPRPDSETIVAAALAATDLGKPCQMLDLGCGTGALLLACLSERPDATGTGVDIASEAVEASTRNARKNGLSARVDFVIGDFSDPDVAPGRYDLILCNPPYIQTGEIDGLAVEVARFDPRLALDGGDDGLDCWRAVLPRIADGLSSGGRACLEVGSGQKKVVLGLAAKAGLCEIGIEKDLAGICRCLVLGLADNPATAAPR